MHTEIFQGTNGLWYWHVKSGNNRIVQASGQGYKTKWGADRAVKKFLGINHTREMILAILLLLTLIALIWALATRNTVENVQASQGEGNIIQRSSPQPVNNPQPSSSLGTPTANPQDGK